MHPFPPFPKGLGEKYYAAGKAYFDRFAGFGPGLRVVAAEKHFQTEIEGYPFVGVADLLLEEEATGKLILTDHKSKSAKSMQKVLNKQLRQLYLYAVHIREAYGRYPDILRLHLFREDTCIDRPFHQGAFQKAKTWAADTIACIRGETCWQPCTPDYFCRFLCSVAYHCPQLEAVGMG